MIIDNDLKKCGYKFLNLKHYDSKSYSDLIKYSYTNHLSEMQKNMRQLHITGYSLFTRTQIEELLIKHKFGFEWSISFHDKPENELEHSHSINIFGTNPGDLRQILDVLIEKVLYGITQYWYFNTITYEYDTHSPLANTLLKIQKDVVATHYNVDIDKVFKPDGDSRWYSQNTYFPKGSFITPHSDGINPGRLCAILIYLSGHHEINYGGNLIIDDGTLVVPPMDGNVVLLDFTEHNVPHAVDILTKEYGRYTYLTFLNF